MEVNNCKRLIAHVLDIVNRADKMGSGHGRLLIQLAWELETLDRALDILPSYEDSKALDIAFGKIKEEQEDKA